MSNFKVKKSVRPNIPKNIRILLKLHEIQLKNENEQESWKTFPIHFPNDKSALSLAIIGQFRRTWRILYDRACL